MMARNELATRNQEVPMTLIEETDPATILRDATGVANVLKEVIEQQKLYATYKGGKKHVLVEGWTTLGALLKVYAYIEYSKKLDRNDEIIYESKAVAKTQQGLVIGEAEALCSSKETLRRKDGSKFIRWTDEHAIKSMAQTRAISKCLRYPLGWIMTLAGYQPTPLEEMPPELADEPIKTQQDGSEILPPKPDKAKKVVNSKPKMQEFKGQGKPVKAENVPKIFKLSKDLEEKFGPVWDAGEDIPNILLRKEAHALVKSETLDDKRFKEIMELSK